MYKFGFIGVGNMGGALAKAVIKSAGKEQVIVSDRSKEKTQEFSLSTGCFVGTNTDIAQNSKFIFLGVKPQMMKNMIEDIMETLSQRSDKFILVSMAAGMPIEKILSFCKKSYPVIRIMPNMPVLANSGMILYSTFGDITDEDISEFKKALEFAGEIDKIEEDKIDAASAISGCGPAFVFTFAEALADAGVECGLTRAKAIDYAVQTILGSAALMKSSDKHSAQLKDEVCSPAGSTICGQRALEEKGFRSAVISAVLESYKRTKELGK